MEAHGTVVVIIFGSTGSYFQFQFNLFWVIRAECRQYHVEKSYSMKSNISWKIKLIFLDGKLSAHVILHLTCADNTN